MVRKMTGRSRTGLAVAGVVGALVLAGCADQSGGSTSAGGEGLEAGATMEEFQEAFADVDEIELKTQTPAPKGSPTGLPMEKYFEAVTEWSDGKITWDIQYSNAIAEPTEADDALVDGRLDMASVLPIYEPSEYPANTVLIEAGFLSDQSAVAGTLSSNAWPNEVAFGSDEIVAEFEDHGMVPMIPVYNSGAQGIFCSEDLSSLDDFDGVSASSSGTAQTKQVEALGASASSIPYTELFESLQRGVVECAATTPTVGVLGGFLAEAPYGVIDPAAGLSLAPGALAFSQSTWEGLPLVAQQLLWDKLDVFMSTNITDKIWPNNAEAATQVKDAGGGIRELDDDARQALQDENATILEDLRGSDAVGDAGALVDAMEEANDRWQGEVDELGLDNPSYEEFDEWLESADVDLTDYEALVMREIFADRRPS